MKRNIIIILIFLVLVLINPMSVKAEDSCGIEINDITATSAVYTWGCGVGELNSYTTYYLNKDETINKDKKVPSGNNSYISEKEGSVKIEGLEANTKYAASFKIGSGNVYNIYFETGTLPSGAKVIKKTTSNNKGGTCTFDVTNITSTSAKMEFDCSKGSMNSVSLYQANEKCERLSDNPFKTYTSGWHFSGKKAAVTFNEFQSDAYFWASFKIGNKNAPWVCFKTSSSAEETPGRILKEEGEKAEIITSTTPNIDGVPVSTTSKSSVNINETNMDDFCDADLRKTIRKYWGMISIIAPIGLMILVIVDFLKAMINNDADAIKKSSSNAIKRVVATMLLLISPWFLSIVFNWFGLDICF